MSRRRRATTRRHRAPAMRSYQTVAVCLYWREIVALDALVKKLKRAGYRANRSRAMGHLLTGGHR